MADDMAEGGLLLLNAAYPPNEVKLGGNIRVATVNASNIALETLRMPITNTAILGAFAKAVGWPKLESIEKAVRKQFSRIMADMNIEAIKRSYDECSEVIPSPVKFASESEALAVNTFGVQKDVSSWRIFQPIIGMDKCTGCKNCWIFCPETAIKWTEENKPEIEWHKCKGCGICVNECPVEAIEFKRVEIKNE
jgi:2-oxoacid:acceptor oxidoreductase delta subunit (pyruvate/2-ketoisovalerate family)